MSPALNVAVDGNHAVEWLVSEVDVANAEHVLALRTAAIAETYVYALILDLSQVSFMDSRGVGALVQLRNHANAAGKRIALRGVPAAVSEILAITDLDHIFGLTDGDAGRC